MICAIMFSCNFSYIYTYIYGNTMVASKTPLLAPLELHNWGGKMLTNWWHYQKYPLHRYIRSAQYCVTFLQSYERMNLADALQPKRFEDNETVIQQGDSADGMYFIEDGTVSVIIKNDVRYKFSFNKKYGCSCVICFPRRF